MRHETGLESFFEIIVGGILYHSGALLLSLLSLGALRLAPLETMGEEDRDVEWTVWRGRPGKRKELKAGWVCIAGVLAWIGIVCVLYSVSQRAPDETEPPDTPRSEKRMD
jgi:hypothetical protein